MFGKGGGKLWCGQGTGDRGEPCFHLRPLWWFSCIIFVINNCKRGGGGIALFSWLVVLWLLAVKGRGYFEMEVKWVVVGLILDIAELGGQGWGGRGREGYCR